MDIREHVLEKARKAKQAAARMAGLPGAVKNRALLAMADALMDSRAAIADANGKDLSLADGYGLTGAAIVCLPPKTYILRII